MKGKNTMENFAEKKFYCYHCAVRLLKWSPEKFTETNEGAYDSCERCYASDSGMFLIVCDNAEKLSDAIDRANEENN
jgi:hypothetical protein